ncbi:High-molecular weight cobalt-containing nitrile hydratase subunit beta [Nymphon striatum]|nr:High-molecular weight cobalt-containing nitrile hydratase subunit beta [Nymphon striatum]
MPLALAAGGPVDRDAILEPGFNAGEQVRALNINPQGHTRLPRYVRGKVGEIVSVQGFHVFPDSNAKSEGENPEWLYSEIFLMATLVNLDAEIEKTRSTVEQMREKLDQSGIVLEEFAKSDTIGQTDFDIENARISDILNQQKIMEGNIADLIIGLEDATNVFGSEFESMKSYTGWEKFIGIFSKQKMQRMRSERVRHMSLAGNLQELLVRKLHFAKVIERRKSAMVNLEATQGRIEELNPMLMDLENQISASTDQKTRTTLEGQRSELATEYNQQQAKEQELLAESQTLERYTSMFQTFVDSLNNQLAAQQTLINKLTIDTEQRVVLYKALEDSLKTAAQQDVAHKINTLGNQVDTAAETTMAGIGAAAQSHIGDLLEMHEKNMVSTEDIQRRKKLADEAFARRFDEVMKKHNSAAYVQ